jgi:MoxR-like ATPase
MEHIRHISMKIRSEMSKIVVGRMETVDMMLVALFAGGHVLLEDVPGTGKTLMAKAFARTLGCSFSRIQCTPDLLPSDLVGTSVFRRNEERFDFLPGPLFNQIVLADEINRAVPRTQSALLECMAEGQITVDGATRHLPQPFMVIATQNPVESRGTFPLPEAQLDRFLLKISPGYPSPEDEASIFRLHRRLHRAEEEVKPVTATDEILEARMELEHIIISEDVERYILMLVWETRKHERIQLGASPRAVIALGRACQALAAISGRTCVIPDDVKKLAVPVLAHRLVMKEDSIFEESRPTEVLENILRQLPAPVEHTGEK